MGGRHPPPPPSEASFGVQKNISPPPLPTALSPLLFSTIYLGVLMHSHMSNTIFLWGFEASHIVVSRSRVKKLLSNPCPHSWFGLFEAETFEHWRHV